MENRIQLNGVWYVREDLVVPETTTNTKEQVFNPDNVTSFEACVYETDGYCWEASRLQKNEDGSFYRGIDIKFTDKTPEDRKDWIEDYWDNNNWMMKVFNGEKDALDEASKSMNEEGVKTFREFLGYLNDLGWLNNE